MGHRAVPRLFCGLQRVEVNANENLDEMIVFKHSPFAEKIPAILREAHEMLWDKPAKRWSQS